MGFERLFGFFPGRQRNNSSFSQPYRCSNRATPTNYDHCKAGGFCGILGHSALRTYFVVKFGGRCGTPRRRKRRKVPLKLKEGRRKERNPEKPWLAPQKSSSPPGLFLLRYLSCTTSRAAWGFQQRSSEAGDCGKSLGSKVFVPPSFATPQLETRPSTKCSRQRELVAFFDDDSIWIVAFWLDSWQPHAQVCKHWTSSPLWTLLVSSPECHSLRWWRSHRCPLIKEMCACYNRV